MSAHAEASGHAHHGPPAANRSSRLDPTTLGMFLFIASEAMLFGSFFTAYFFVRVVNPIAPAIWPPPPYEFPVVRRRREHGDPRHLELHDALGDAVDQAATTVTGSARVSSSRSCWARRSSSPS